MVCYGRKDNDVTRRGENDRREGTNKSHKKQPNEVCTWNV